MAASSVITCPECKKKFKGKADLQGKKIRCPFCKEPFVVAEDEEEATIPPSTSTPTGGEGDDEFDENGNPYGITKLDLAPRCPNCANEMESEAAVVCLFCGYNTLTRTWGKTKKVFDLTFRDYFLHLLRGNLAVLGILLAVTGSIFYSLVLPNMKTWGWLEFVTDSESTRLWVAAILLGMSWGLGVFAFNRLVLNPKPPDKVKD
jgi:hypothetical protein